MKRKILVVSHCFLNDAAKLKFQDPVAEAKEREKKRRFLMEMLENDIELIQLPCPEVNFYGTNRWGHVSEQFDTPFFKEQSRKLLLPVVRDLEEYSAYPERFEILGIYGINGSPSCGVDQTCSGEFGGAMQDRKRLEKELASGKRVSKPGIFMQVFGDMLKERHLDIPFYGL